jgi:Spy/CpxP family protein refolding chaperone
MPPSGSAQGQSGTSSAAPQHSDPVADELGLTPDQRNKLQPIIDDEVKQISAVRDDNSLTLQQKQQKVQQIREAGFPKIQAILTPEQRQKLAQMQAEHAHQQQGAPQGSASQPPH